MAYRKRKKSDDRELESNYKVVSHRPNDGRRSINGRFGFLRPRWMVNLYESWGYIPGFIVFAVLMVVLWPVLLALVSSCISLIATEMVSSFGDVVPDSHGANVAMLMRSPNVFFFRWIGPTLFLNIVAALLTVWVVKIIIRAAWRVSMGWAGALFAGHNESLSDNYRRRKREKVERKSIQAREGKKKKRFPWSMTDMSKDDEEIADGEEDRS